MIQRLKSEWARFLVGFPCGLMGQIYLTDPDDPSHDPDAKWTIWDSIRYRLLVGVWSSKIE